MSAKFDYELARGTECDGDDEAVWEEPTHNMLGRAVTEAEWDEWVIGNEVGVLDAANAASAPDMVDGVRLPRAVMRDVHEDLYGDGIVDIDLLHAVTEASHWQQWSNFKADYRECPEQMTLWVDDEGYERDFTKALDVIDDDNPYWAYIDLTDREGRAVALPKVPKMLRGTDAASQIVDTFEAVDADDEAAKAAALARAVYRLAYLDQLALMADKCGDIPEVWEYPYPMRPDPFQTQLANVLAAIHGVGLVGKSEAREAIERGNAGAWKLISRAALNIDGDYRAAVRWAERTGDDKWRWVAKEYETTRDRYIILRGMHHDATPDGLHKAIMDSRATRDARVVAIAKPVDRTHNIGQLTGQGHLSSLIQQIRDGSLEAEASWKPSTTKHTASVALEAAPQAIDALQRISEPANLTDAGIRSMADAASQVIREATAGTASNVLVPSNAFVSARKATAKSERVHHAARHAAGSINDIDAFLEACSYMRLSVDYWGWDADGKPEHRTRNYPLFSAIHETDGRDAQGNPIASAWWVNLHSLDAFEDTGLVKPHKMPLLELMDSDDEHRRLTDLEASFLRFIDDKVRDLVNRSEKGRGRSIEIDAEELVNLGHGNAGMTARQARRFMDRLGSITIDAAGRKAGTLKDIERTYLHDPTQPTVVITPRTKKGNRRKSRDGKQLPPKVKLVGLRIKLATDSEGRAMREAYVGPDGR